MRDNDIQKREMDEKGETKSKMERVGKDKKKKKQELERCL